MTDPQHPPKPWDFTDGEATDESIDDFVASMKLDQPTRYVTAGSIASPFNHRAVTNAARVNPARHRRELPALRTMAGHLSEEEARGMGRLYYAAWLGELTK